MLRYNATILDITNLVYEKDKKVILMYVDIYVYVYLDWCMCYLLLNAVYNQRSRDKTHL